MSEKDYQSGPENHQSQDVNIGHDFRVEGKGHQVDFSQTHIETQIIHHISETEVQARELISASPYKGLRKFEATDYQRFFGRESLVADLIAHLETYPWLIVLGASGSGKSSLVRAGIIPKLIERQGSNLIDLTFTPDEDPFDSFYASLLGYFKQADAKIARKGDPDTLIKVVRKLQAPNIPWFIFIDQFEELFSITHPQKRETFISSLLKLQHMMVQQQSANRTGDAPPLYLVLAMRADFLDQFSPYQELGKLTERYMRFITNMTRDDLQRAIATPANLHGVAYQDGLLKEILNDLQDQPGELPLLQYTLDLLWKRADLTARLICCDTYWAINGVQGALRQHVDEIYHQLSKPDQLRARQIFLSLVDTSANRENIEGAAKAVSRRAYLSQFTDSETRQVLTKLIDSNLLVSNWQQGENNTQEQGKPSGQNEFQAANDGDASRQATVELAHETLIRSWPLLQTWLEENQEIINLKHRLSDEARRWNTIAQASPEQAKDELWRGSKLERVIELREAGVFDSLFGGLETAEVEFINAGVEERDRQQNEQEKRRKKELLLYRSFGIGAVTALALTTGLGIATALGWRSAERQEINALITDADAKFVDDPHSLDTLIAAMEAGSRLQSSLWFRGNTILRAEALQVVSQAVYWVREKKELTAHSHYVESVTVSPDEDLKNQMIATGSQDGTVRIWTSQGKELETLMKQDVPFSHVKFSPDGLWLAMADYDGNVTLWSKRDKSLQPLGNSKNGHQQVVREVSFHPTEPIISTVSDDNTVKIWNISGELLQTLPDHQASVDAVAYSPDGQFLITGGDNRTVIVWDHNGNQIETIDDLPSSVLNLSFNRGEQWLIEGDWLAIAMSNGEVQIRRFEPDGLGLLPPETILRGHQGGVTTVQFSPSGTKIATTSVDGTVMIWNRFGKVLYTMKSHTSRINGADFNDAGTILATASHDNTVKLWNLANTNQRILSGHSDTVYSVRFSDSDELLASSGTDDTAILWDTSTITGSNSQLLLASDDVVNVAISPKNRYVAGALLDGTVKLWPIDESVNSESASLIIPAHEGIVSDVRFTPDGQTLISSGHDATVRFWRVEDGKLQDTIQSTEKNLVIAIYGLGLNRDSSQLITANHQNSITIWELDTQRHRTINVHGQPVHQAIFTPDGQTLVTASADRTIKLWNLDGELQKELIGHNNAIWGLDISSDNQLIASSSDDSLANIWTTRGEHLFQLVGHQEAVNSVSFSYNRHWLATGSADDTVILWNVQNLSLQEFLDQGCNWLSQSQYEGNLSSNQAIHKTCNK